MSEVTVSVVVPAYNAENYIRQCMDSLVNQTLHGMEIVCVDDGSTDDTGKILDEYAAIYPNVIVLHQECISQANAVNRGARFARGEYIAECDADDFVNLQMYERLYRLAEHKADAVRCGFMGVWDNGRLQPNPLNVSKELTITDPHTLVGKEKALVFGKMVLIPSGIYKRSFILDNELFWREGGQNYEDTCVSFKIRATARDYRFLDECLYYYRRGNPGSGSATIRDEFAICEQYEEIERYDAAHGGLFMDYMDCRRYYDYMWSLSRTPEERRGKFVLKCMEDFRNHPAKREYFNNDDDFRAYCLIKYGAWLETGVLL